MNCTTSVTNFVAVCIAVSISAKLPGKTIMNLTARICKFVVFYMIACISIGFLYSMIVLFANQPLVLAIVWLWYGNQFWRVIVKHSEVFEQMVRANFVDWPEILLARMDAMEGHDSEDEDEGAGDGGD